MSANVVVFNGQNAPVAGASFLVSAQNWAVVDTNDAEVQTYIHAGWLIAVDVPDSTDLNPDAAQAFQELADDQAGP